MMKILPQRVLRLLIVIKTMNRDYQKQFSNNNFAQQAITKGAQTAAIDVAALDQRVNDRAKLSRARSTSMAGDIFGDMFNLQTRRVCNPVKE